MGGTNENGVVEIAVMQASNYVITAESEGFYDGSTEVSLDREAFIELEPEPVEHTIRIVDEDGDGIEGADVTVTEAAVVQRTDADGEITMEFDAGYDPRNSEVSEVSHEEHEDRGAVDFEPEEGGVTIIELEADANDPQLLIRTV